MDIKECNMKDEEIRKIIEAISEDYSLEELLDERAMLPELRTLLDVDPTTALLILVGARLWRIRRGDRLPDWQLLLQLQ